MYRRTFLALTASMPAAYAVARDEKETRVRILLGLERPELFGDDFNMQKEAADAFNAMSADALKEGIDIYSQSSYRGFDHQKRIWNRKYSWYRKRQMTPEQSIEAILRFSSMPGGSRHHWGTDVDMIDRTPRHEGGLLNQENYVEGGVFQDLYVWLLEHGTSYDFHLVYTDDKDRPGFAFEPWHWSYAPIAIPYLKDYLELDIQSLIPIEELDGHEYLNATHFQRYMDEWVRGINPALLPA